MRLPISPPSTHAQSNLLSSQALLLLDCVHRYLAIQHKRHGLPCHAHRPKDQLLYTFNNQIRRGYVILQGWQISAHKMILCADAQRNSLSDLPQSINGDMTHSKSCIVFQAYFWQNTFVLPNVESCARPHSYLQQGWTSPAHHGL